MESNKKSFSRELLKNNIFSVSAYISVLNGILNLCEAKIKGEVGEVKKSSAGHVYFSLKDKKDNSVLSCVIWNYDYRVSGVELEDGLEIIAEGMPDIYAPNGRISFKVKNIQLVGEGELKKAYEKLKKKLEEEGLFDEERKKSLPVFPKRIGLITSKHGAVINDFLSNIGHHGFEIRFIDSRVEGQEAIRDLISAIRAMREEEVDVLLIMRGGGSLESFMAFNNEMVIREVVDFSAPVVVALGHDKDIPLVAFVADRAVSTPTASAMLLNESWKKIDTVIDNYSIVIGGLLENVINRQKALLNNSFLMINNYFESALHDYYLKENYLKSIIKNKLENRFEGCYKELSLSERIVEQNNPERNLNLGYCIARSNGLIVKKGEAMKIDSVLDIEFIDSLVRSKIINIENKKHENKK